MQNNVIPTTIYNHVAQLSFYEIDETNGALFGAAGKYHEHSEANSMLFLVFRLLGENGKPTKENSQLLMASHHSIDEELIACQAQTETKLRCLFKHSDNFPLVATFDFEQS